MLCSDTMVSLVFSLGKLYVHSNVILTIPHPLPPLKFAGFNAENRITKSQIGDHIIILISSTCTLMQNSN